jgi:FHA domain-containing protein/type VI secretion system protein
MSLILRIQSYRKQDPAQPVERRFDHLGGTIGRAAGNDLELPDPAKYISRTHCKVDFADGRYTLVDMGSNPSWINDRPLGPGKTAQLADGDLLTIGDYVLQAVLDEPAAAMPVPVFAPDYSPSHPFQAQPELAQAVAAPEYVNPADTLSSAKILDTGAGPGMLGNPSADDPLGLNLFGQSGPAADPLAFRGSEFDHAPPQLAAFQVALAPELVPEPPAPVSVPVAPPVPPAPTFAPATGAAAPMLIPEDYDPLADLLGRGVQPALPAAPVHVAPAQAAPAMPLAIPPIRPAGDDEVLQALLRGLGLPGLKTNRPATETAELVGAMLREATAGTMEVLMARAMTKRESRLELTVIGAQANNPLKFFPDAKEALAQMLTNAMAGYMPPLKSYGSAFDDLKAHEMAVIAGMRAALAGVLARFNPALIEHAMEPQGVMDKMLTASRKAKMWDRMVELYDEIAREADDDFQRLFGDRFSSAYADQIERLQQDQRFGD